MTAARRGDSDTGDAANDGKEHEYLTPGQAARILHVSPKTVDRWANQGRVPCIVTLGGHRRFSRDDIEAVAEEMAKGSARRDD